MANDEKVLDAYFAAYFEDEEGDEEYIPVAVEDWKQVQELVFYVAERGRGWT